MLTSGYSCVRIRVPALDWLFCSRSSEGFGVLVVGLLFSPSWFALGRSGGVVSVTWARYHGDVAMSQSVVMTPETVEGKGAVELICS